MKEERYLMSEELIFKYEGSFRINQMEVLSRKYDLEPKALYEYWNKLDRCSFIKLEQWIKEMESKLQQLHKFYQEILL